VSVDTDDFSAAAALLAKLTHQVTKAGAER
jgi:hypothetical protein